MHSVQYLRHRYLDPHEKAALSLNRQTARRTAVIVAEYPIWLDAFQLLLERLGVEVAGRAVREEEAIRLLEEHRPDMFLADFPAITDDVGSPLLARARAANPEVRCIVLSERDEPAEMERAFGAGALIFCARRTDPDDLAAAIRQSFDRSIYFATGPRGPRPRVATPDASDDPLAALTRREVEILRLAAEGFSNAQIAKSLWVTEQTVKFHLSNIYRKVGVGNRTEASRWAQRHGVLPGKSAA